MSPHEIIRERYNLSEHERDWEWWVRYFMNYGFVFATPDFFAMGRASRKGVLVLAGHWHEMLFDREDCDCWYVFAMAGDMAKAWSILPYELPWIAFERIRAGKRELAFYKTADLRRLTPRMDEQVITF